MKKWMILPCLALSACMPAGRLPLSPPALPAAPSYAPAAPSLSTSAQPGKLSISVLDVGQGDSSLIQMPNGKALLIDGGKDGKGQSVILPFLESKGLPSLEAIVLTHYDADHMAGLDEVLAVHPPEQGVFDRGGLPLDDSPFYPAYAAAAEGIRHTLQPGDEIKLDSSVTLRCVAVGGQIWQGPLLSLDGNFSQKENAASIALLIEYGKFRYLTSGDLTGGGAPGGFQTLDLETPLAQTLGKLSAVHINHHGSSTSSNPAFVEASHPSLALFSLGDENEYNHPAQEVLERWKAIGSDLWLTEKGKGGFIAGEHIVQGPILLETDGEEIVVNGIKYPLGSPN